MPIALGGVSFCAWATLSGVLIAKVVRGRLQGTERVGSNGIGHALCWRTLEAPAPGSCEDVRRRRLAVGFESSQMLLVASLGLGLAPPPATSVRALHRFAVKGLERDELPSVLLSANEGFPSDRRWALRFDDAKPFDATQPEWLHKSNFLCAFTATELLAGFVTTFDDATATLHVWRRSALQYYTREGDLLGEEPGDELLVARLDEEQGRAAAASFFSDACGRGCSVVTAGASHQFGNTGSGLKASGDIRTVHLVNENTVAALSEACGAT